MKEINTVNVISMLNGNINIVSFEETLEGNDAAEELFEKLFKKIIQDKCEEIDEDYKDDPDFQNIEDYVMDGYYNGYPAEDLYIIHSNRIVEEK